MELRLKRYHQRKLAEESYTLECRGEGCTEPKQAFLFEGGLCPKCYGDTNLVCALRRLAQTRRRRGRRL